MEKRSVDLSVFQRAIEDIVASNENAFQTWYNNYYTERIREYTFEEIERIVHSDSLDEIRVLSRVFFKRDGLYKKLNMYYASLLLYTGLLIPYPGFGKSLSNSKLQKKYNAALQFLDKISLKKLFYRISLRALVDGSYYGVIKVLDKKNFVLFDLPAGYARSRYRDFEGNDIVEFDVRYFNTIFDEGYKRDALNSYPDIISSYYKKYNQGLVTSAWVRIPADVGVCFSFTDDGRPLFLEVIPGTMQYTDAIDTERELQIEEIKKILIQKVPHLTDGQLLFEPPEAVEMHQGTVKMLASNPHVSVLTTYADATLENSRTTSENEHNTLEKMLQAVYSKAGVSAQLFAPTGSQALSTSIKNDISIMMVLANQYAHFISYIVNFLFANSNISFKYIMLPVSLYNQNEYVGDAMKLAQSGYSFLQVAAAMDLDQASLMGIKDLENNALELSNVLVPLASSYTSSGSPGAPTKDLEDKAPKTIQNEQSLDNQGGSDNG